jgi:hypothetical protein
MRLRRYTLTTLGLVFAMLTSTGLVNAASYRAPNILTCDGKLVARPVTYVIFCADGNGLLTATHWTHWGPTSAVGTTRFALNLCKPNCAAAWMSYFPRSTVRLSAVVASKHYGLLFTKLKVTYTQQGKIKTLTMTLSS